MSDDRLRCIFDHISHDQGDCVAWKHAAFVSAAVFALSLDEQFYVEQRSVDVLATYRDVSPLSDLSRHRAIVLSGEDSRHVLCLHWSLNSKLDLFGFK